MQWPPSYAGGGSPYPAEWRISALSLSIGLTVGMLVAIARPSSQGHQFLVLAIAALAPLVASRALLSSPLAFVAESAPILVGGAIAVLRLPAEAAVAWAIAYLVTAVIATELAWSGQRTSIATIRAQLRERGLLAQQWSLFSTNQLAIALTRGRQLDRANTRFKEMFGEGSGDALLLDLARVLGRSRRQLDSLLDRAEARITDARSRALKVLLEGATPRYFSIHVRRFDPQHPEKGLLWTISDQTSEWLRRQAVERAASRDPLTGALNRRAFEHRVARLLRRDLQRHPLALLTIDLTGLGTIQAAHGQAYADQIRCILTKRMQHLLRAQDLIARFGEDEFVIALDRVDEAEHAVMVADKLIATIGAPVVMSSTSSTVGASVGVGIAPRDGLSLQSLLLRADEAMYAVKRALGQGKSNRNVRR
ncbi:MAG: GGDEF domain-containing protein [Burkholderiaceae bacterium]